MKLISALTPEMLHIFETLPDLYLILSPDLLILTASDSYLEATFTQRNAIVGRHIFEVFPDNPQTPEANAVLNLRASLLEVLATKKPHQMAIQHYDVPDPSQRERFIERYWAPLNTPVLDKQGEVSYIIHKVVNVTEQVLAQKQIRQGQIDVQMLNEELETTNEELRATNEELTGAKTLLEGLNNELEARVEARTRELQLAQAEAQNQRDRLERLFMQAPAIICIHGGPDLIFELVNPAYQQLFSGRELLGKSLLEALPELEGQPLMEIIHQVYQTGQSYQGQEMLVPISSYPGGPVEERYWNFTYQARRDAYGQVDGMLVFSYDVTDQVVARRKVEASEKQLRLLTDALPVLISYLDREERYQFANRAYESWFHIPSESLLGKPVREVIGEKAYQGVKEYIHRALSGERLDFEAKMPYRDDFTKYIYTSYVPDIQNGNVEGFYALVTDVTDTIEARKKIEESAAQVRSFVESAPFPIGVYVGREMRIEFANQAILDAWGKGNDVIGKRYADVLPELENQEIFNQLDGVYTSGKAFHAKNQRVDLVVDEELQPYYFNYSFTPLYDSQGNIYGVMNTAAEVTDLVIARNKAEESDLFARTLIQQSPVAQVVFQGEEMIISTVNEKMLELLGRDDSIIGKPFMEAVPEFRATPLMAHLREVLQTGQAYYQSEERLELIRYGQPYTGYYEYTYQALMNTRGEKYGIIVTGAEVTSQVEARKKIEKSEQAAQELAKELAASNEELVSANEEITSIVEELSMANTSLKRTNVDLDNFIYTASHDLKAPISNIEALLAALLRTLPADSLSAERTQSITGMMQDSVERFKKTIANLTEVVKLQKENSGEAVLVDLSEVIKEVCFDLDPLIKTATAQLEINVTDCPFIRFSAKNLRSVVYNLLSNALKYRSPDRIAKISISCQSTLQFNILTIQDNGLGMESGRISQLFTMFKRFHDHVEGTGIGLYMVKKMVENAEGKIEVDSKVDVGTTFRVYFRK
ncbi:PAS domain-containing protein [Rhodocytophaga rosea]|uniref:histidine kinase n=1 Tax=Rhodocytophaga rosea TaxID=2704465 RepID=A0A6C0GEQ2_9BACT|nr:PAS domain-containing sensor histidine kinase [Rhodocytophaga rosea]QHT66253.1 PAS domain-containing protein [Rhodocytophaga rosea]